MLKSKPLFRQIKASLLLIHQIISTFSWHNLRIKLIIALFQNFNGAVIIALAKINSISEFTILDQATIQDLEQVFREGVMRLIFFIQHFFVCHVKFFLFQVFLLQNLQFCLLWSSASDKLVLEVYVIHRSIWNFPDIITLKKSEILNRYLKVLFVLFFFLFFHRNFLTLKIFLQLSNFLYDLLFHWI